MNIKVDLGNFPDDSIIVSFYTGASLYSKKDLVKELINYTLSGDESDTVKQLCDKCELPYSSLPYSGMHGALVRDKKARRAINGDKWRYGKITYAWVMKKNSTILSWAALIKIPKNTELQFSIYVRPEYRQQKVGTVLYHTVCSYLSELDVSFEYQAHDITSTCFFNHVLSESENADINYG